MSYSNIKVEVDEYAEGEAEYDASDYQARVMGTDGEGDEVIIALCGNKLEAEHIAKLLIANPFPFGERI